MNRDLPLGRSPALTLPGLATMMRAAARTLARWRRRSRTRAQLDELPPHLLRDIGLDRASARAEARKWFWRV